MRKPIPITSVTTAVNKRVAQIEDRLTALQRTQAQLASVLRTLAKQQQSPAALRRVRELGR